MHSLTSNCRGYGTTLYLYLESPMGKSHRSVVPSKRPKNSVAIHCSTVIFIFRPYNLSYVKGLHMEHQFATHQSLMEFMDLEDHLSGPHIHPQTNACDSFSLQAYKDSKENECPLNQSNYAEEEEEEKEGRPCGSKNLFSERRRRSKLNERLCALRSVVPNISKLDKASVLCDAIDYVHHLQKEIKDVEAQILGLQSDNVAPKLQCPETAHDREITKRHDVQLTEINVSTMGEKAIFNLTAYCKEGARALEPLIRTFVSLKLEIQGANFNCFNEHINGTITTQINSEEAVHPNKLKEMFVEAAGFNGFQTSLKMRIA